MGRVIAVRSGYDRYLCVEQRDVEVEVEVAGGGGKARKKEVVSYDVVSHPRAHCAFVVAFPFHPARGGGGGGGRDDDDSHASANATNANAGFASTSAPTVTLLREYCHGINGWLYTLPTGGLDPKKHGGGGDEGEGGEGENPPSSLPALPAPPSLPPPPPPGGGRGERGVFERAAAAELSEEAGLEGGDWECLLPDIEEDEDDEEGDPLFRNPLAAGIPEAKWCANRFWPFLVVGSSEAAQPGERDREEKLGTMEVLRVTVPELESIIAKGRMLLPSVQTSWMALQRLRERGLV